MTIPTAGTTPSRKKRAKPLTQVLVESQHVHELIDQSTEELSSANIDIKQEIADSGPLAGAEIGLRKCEAVEIKLVDASKKLITVNQALEDEVRDRTLVNHQLAAAEEQVGGARNAALHDDLTGLPNRTLFNDRLGHEISQAVRHEWILAVMFLDLDKFKAVNDTYGHDIGDAALKIFAKRLKDNSRAEDTISRYGGDEFLYLLTQVREQKDMAMIAAKILRAIQAPCNVSVRDLTFNLSIGDSIGISVFPKDGTTADELIKRADEAMYRAKESNSGYAFAQ